MFLEQFSVIICHKKDLLTKRSFWWHIITRLLFKKHCFPAFLKRFQELCEWKDLSGGKLYMIVVQKALLSWQYLTKRLSMVKIHRQKVFSRKHSLFFEKISRIMWTKTSFLWHISTRSLFKKHCFLDKIWPRNSQWWKYFVKKCSIFEKAFFSQRIPTQKDFPSNFPTLSYTFPHAD